MSSLVTASGCSCCAQCPAPSTKCVPRQLVQTVDCIASSTPGFWYEPQSLLPAMKQAGTSTVRPENVRSSASVLGSVPRRTR